MDSSHPQASGCLSFHIRNFQTQCWLGPQLPLTQPAPALRVWIPRNGSGVSMPKEETELQSCKDHSWTSLHQKWTAGLQRHLCEDWGCSKDNAHLISSGQKLPWAAGNTTPSKIMRAACFPSVKIAARQITGMSKCLGILSLYKGISRITSQETGAGLRHYLWSMEDQSLPPSLSISSIAAKWLWHSSEAGLGASAEAGPIKPVRRGWGPVQGRHRMSSKDSSAAGRCTDASYHSLSK